MIGTSVKKELNRAAGIDNLSGRFLNDGIDVLTMPITQIFNILIKRSHFPKTNLLTEPKNFSTNL